MGYFWEDFVNKVAVCIASTRPELLVQTLDSILEQDYGNITLAIVHDVHPVGLAKNSAVNRAISMGADYIQMVDDDDLLEPTMISECAKVLDENPKIGWVLCWGRTFGRSAGYVHSEMPTLKDQLDYNHLHSWAMFRASVLKRTNFRETLKWCDDWDLWIRIFKKRIKGVILKKELYNYRVHDKRLTETEGGTYSEKKRHILRINGYEV
jgi:glycosyltransferase involved in cell wall biosynthesis